MNSKNHPIIAVVTASANAFAERELLSGIISAAAGKNCRTVVFSNIYNMYSTDDDLICEQSIYELILSDGISGIIVMSESFIEAKLREKIAVLLKRKNVPVVVAGASLPEFSDPRFCCINTSDSDDIFDLTSHLIEIHGFTDIALLTGMPDVDISIRREEGFRSALSSHGIVPDDSRIFYGNYWINSGSELADRFISDELPLPQAIVCANDSMAYGLLSKFAENHIRVPEDVTVVSYEYSDNRLYYSPLLTSYHRSRRELGELAVKAICCMMDGEAPPEYAPPAGSIVFGDSCSCPRDNDKYNSDLNYAIIQKNYSDYGLLSTMEHKLAVCRDMESFINIIGDHLWLIRNVLSICMCLYSDWYDLSSSSSDIMLCRCLMPWRDTSVFEAGRDDFSVMFEKYPGTIVCYYNPIFSGSKLFGHMVLMYETPESYESVFRYWLKSVSIGLEFLRLKNDIRYLLSCQNLSEYRDTLTGMYNEKGIRRAFTTVSGHDNKTLYMLMLKICLFSSSVNDVNISSHTEAVTGASKAIGKFCGNHDISGYIHENTFVCIVQSNASAEQLSDLLSCILLREKNYMDNAGMDTFVCFAAACGDSSFDELLTQCRNGCDEKIRGISERRAHYHYKKMLSLRNRIYAAPEITFDNDELIIEDDSIDTFRIHYKKCFGISFHQDCIAARTAKAKYYLVTTSLGMTEIAEKCGYFDNKYFLRQFSANVGVPALQYRNLIKR